MALLDHPCIYCGLPSDLTRDHVPPKCFFPKPRPSNLITVPSCIECNREISADEEHFLATLMFGDAGTSSTGKLLWTEKLNRMYEKNLGLRKRIARALSYTDIFSKGGIYLGHSMTIDVDEKRAVRVLHKMLRGLYFFEYGEPLDSTAQIGALWLHTADHYATAWTHREQLHIGRRGWPGTFVYSCNRVPERPSGSAWLIVMFDTVSFFAVTNKPRIQVAAGEGGG